MKRVLELFGVVCVVSALMILFSTDAYAGWFSKKPVTSVKPAVTKKELPAPVPAPTQKPMVIQRMEGTNLVVMAIVADGQVRIAPNCTANDVILRLIEVYGQLNDNYAKINDLRNQRDKATAKVLTEVLSWYGGPQPLK